MNSSAPNSPAVPAPRATSLRHVRSDVLGMQGYTPGEQVSDCVKLNTNECAYEPAPGVLEALRAIGANHLRLYPDPLATRLRTVAGERYGVRSSQVLAGNGSDDCLTLIYRAFLPPGEHVATPWPTYGLYDTLATLQGVRIHHLDYTPGWHLPSNLARVGAKVVIVANPNNPSATLTPVQQLRTLADQLDGILVVDEAYVDFALGAGIEASLLPYLDKHPNLIVLRTFSKSYSLAGARLGLLFAHEQLVEQLVKVKDSYNVNAITQALGTAALQDHAYHRALIAQTLAERVRLEQGVARFGWTWPASAANFLLCQVGEQAGRIYHDLKQRRILVRWWDRPELRTSLRITVGRPEQTDALLAAVRECL